MAMTKHSPHCACHPLYTGTQPLTAPKLPEAGIQLLRCHCSQAMQLCTFILTLGI